MDGGFEPQVSIDDHHSHQKVNSLTDMESGNFGRRCKIRAPCCDGIFDCRHSHKEAKNSLEVDPLDRHDVPCHDVKWIICSLCNTEQDVQQHCVQCGVCMGNYFCSKCKFFDDDVSKKQYHYDRCGIHAQVAKSFRDMSCVWEKLDEEVAGTPMPQKYQNKMVWILCNDRGETSQVNFHVVAHKCLKCKSYNTRKTREGPASFSSRITAR